MYTFNTSFFHDIDCADKAYLLGFICTDGNIYKRDDKHQTQIQISIRDYDVEILQHFISSLESNHPISEHKDKRRPSTVMNSVAFVSDEMAQDLLKLSLGPNKTFTLNYNKIFNCIDEHLWNSFLLGIFDGDGNISIPNDNTISKSHVRLSGPITQLQQIQTVLQSIGINLIIVEDVRDYTQPFGSLECKNTTDKYCLLKYLYNTNVECLARKKEIALELMRRVESNITNRAENKRATQAWEILKENLNDRTH